MHPPDPNDPAQQLLDGLMQATSVNQAGEMCMGGDHLSGDAAELVVHLAALTSSAGPAPIKPGLLGACPPQFKAATTAPPLGSPQLPAPQQQGTTLLPQGLTAPVDPSGPVEYAVSVSRVLLPASALNAAVTKYTASFPGSNLARLNLFVTVQRQGDNQPARSSGIKVPLDAEGRVMALGDPTGLGMGGGWVSFITDVVKRYDDAPPGECVEVVVLLKCGLKAEMPVARGSLKLPAPSESKTLPIKAMIADVFGAGYLPLPTYSPLFAAHATREGSGEQHAGLGRLEGVLKVVPTARKTSPMFQRRPAAKPLPPGCDVPLSYQADWAKQSAALNQAPMWPVWPETLALGVYGGLLDGLFIKLKTGHSEAACDRTDPRTAPLIGLWSLGYVDRMTLCGVLASPQHTGALPYLEQCLPGYLSHPRAPCVPLFAALDLLVMHRLSAKILPLLPAAAQLAAEETEGFSADGCIAIHDFGDLLNSVRDEQDPANHTRPPVLDGYEREWLHLWTPWLADAGLLGQLGVRSDRIDLLAMRRDLQWTADTYKVATEQPERVAVTAPAFSTSQAPSTAEHPGGESEEDTGFGQAAVSGEQVELARKPYGQRGGVKIDAKAWLKKVRQSNTIEEKKENHYKLVGLLELALARRDPSATEGTISFLKDCVMQSRKHIFWQLHTSGQPIEEEFQVEIPAHRLPGYVPPPEEFAGNAPVLQPNYPRYQLPRGWQPPPPALPACTGVAPGARRADVGACGKQ